MEYTLDGYRKLLKEIDMLLSSRKTKVQFLKTSEAKKAESLESASRLKYNRDAELESCLRQEKQAAVDEVRRQHQQLVASLELALRNNKSKAEADIKAVDVSDIKAEIDSKLTNLDLLQSMREEMDTTFNDILGVNTTKLLSIRVNNLNLSALSVLDLCGKIDELGELITSIRKQAPFKEFSMKKPLGILFFRPEILGLNDETTAWMWYVYLAVLAAAAYFLDFILTIPIAVLLIYTAINNFRKYYMLYNMYVPYIQLSSSLENLDQAVDVMMTKHKRKRIADIKVAANKVATELEAQIFESQNIVVQDARDAELNFDSALHTRRLNEKFESDIIKYENQAVAMDSKIKKFTEDLIAIDKQSEEMVVKRESYKDAIRDANSVQNGLKADSKLLISEFFFDFDGNRPITLDLKNRAACIFYRAGTGDKEPVMLINLVKTIFVQFLLKMDPRAISLAIVDQQYGGRFFAKFNAARIGEGSSGDESTLFRMRTSAEEVRTELESLYSEFKQRRYDVLTEKSDIETYNIGQIENRSKTLPYIVNIFYAYDEKVLEDEQLHQLIRNSLGVGIIPIIFIDIDKFDRGEFSPETALKFVDVFNTTELRTSLFTFEKGSQSFDTRTVHTVEYEEMHGYFMKLTEKDNGGV